MIGAGAALALATTGPIASVIGPVTSVASTISTEMPVAPSRVRAIRAPSSTTGLPKPRIEQPYGETRRTQSGLRSPVCGGCVGVAWLLLCRERERGYLPLTERQRHLDHIERGRRGRRPRRGGWCGVSVGVWRWGRAAVGAQRARAITRKIHSEVAGNVLLHVSFSRPGFVGTWGGK